MMMMITKKKKTTKKLTRRRRDFRRLARGNGRAGGRGKRLSS
jgi:hypothetical protein